jgi:hypothetical protein
MARPIVWRGRSIDLDDYPSLDDLDCPGIAHLLVTSLLAAIDAPSANPGPAAACERVVSDLERIAFALFREEILAERRRVEARRADVAQRSRRDPISADLRRAVFERDAYRCRRCGGWENLCADHVIPFSKGGPTTLENLQALCGKCNSSKGARSEGEW